MHFFECCVKYMIRAYCSTLQLGEKKASSSKWRCTDLYFVFDEKLRCYNITLGIFAVIITWVENCR